MMKPHPPQFNINQMNAMASSSFNDPAQMQFSGLGNSMQARNALLHQLAQHPQSNPAARQLELMSMAQHQQNQHLPPSGSVNAGLNMIYTQSQQQGQQHQPHPSLTAQNLQDHQRPPTAGPQNPQFNANGRAFNPMPVTPARASRRQSLRS